VFQPSEAPGGVLQVVLEEVDVALDGSEVLVFSGGL
jgi:hypothetical protein